MEPKDINKLRKELGWSLAQFGRYFGVTAQTVLRWEKGTARPGDLTMAALIQLQNRLDALKDQQQLQQFKQGLQRALLTGGILALLAFLFNQND